MSATGRSISTDTFEGQPEPAEIDRDIWGNSQREGWQRYVKDGVYIGERPPIDEVRENLRQTGYDERKTILVKGKVEDTLPAQSPGQIAILRLDTDWYESVSHTFTHLYPLLSPGGVLIVDDYGHLEGARKATDDYMAGLKAPPIVVPGRLFLPHRRQAVRPALVSFHRVFQAQTRAHCMPRCGPPVYIGPARGRI